MSRVGRKPIEVPQGVTVRITQAVLEVQGPKGKLETPVPRGIRVRQEKNQLVVRPAKLSDGPVDQKTIDQLAGDERATWGLARALAANAVRGVTEGYSKELEIVGVGYKADKQGKKVVFSLGYSHPVEFPLPEGIDVKIERSKLTVSGIDKYLVGQIVANMRALRPPDPYKQKGVRRVGECLRKKAGKAAAATGAK